jgi:hypothetical protein
MEYVRWSYQKQTNKKIRKCLPWLSLSVVASVSEERVPYGTRHAHWSYQKLRTTATQICGDFGSNVSCFSDHPFTVCSFPLFS